MYILGVNIDTNTVMNTTKYSGFRVQLFYVQRISNFILGHRLGYQYLYVVVLWFMFEISEHDVLYILQVTSSRVGFDSARVHDRLMELVSWT